jgi:glycosyltransferase involved in cell wall biosynthesis
MISVVIPIYNGEQDLPELINCLKAQTYPLDEVEYLLIDNNSCDRTAMLIEAAAKGFLLSSVEITAEAQRTQREEFDRFDAVSWENMNEPQRRRERRGKS